MSNETEIIELFDKYHLGQLTEEERSQVVQMIDGNENLSEVFYFRRSLISAVRQNKKEELWQRFEMLNEKVKAKEVSEESGDNVIVWRNEWLWAAAAAVILVILGLMFFQKNSKKIDETISKNDDSLKVIKKDSVLEYPKQPIEKNISEKNSLEKKGGKVLEGIIELPYYESVDGSLGFGNDDRPVDHVMTLFIKAKEAGYNYGDTLKIYLPTLPDVNSKWRVVYDRSKDIYYLVDQKKKYELHRDRGYQPLKID